MSEELNFALVATSIMLMLSMLLFITLDANKKELNSVYQDFSELEDELAKEEELSDYLMGEIKDLQIIQINREIQYEKDLEKLEREYLELALKYDFEVNG